MGLEKYKRDMMCCTRCGSCKIIQNQKAKSWKYNRVCPIHKRYGFDAYSAQGFMEIGKLILDGKLNFEGKLPHILYSCILCGFCDYACKWTHANAEILDIILELRAKIVEAGKGPMPQHKAIAENIAKYHNVYGRPHEERFSWMLKETKSADKADIVYFVGCATSYLKPQIAQATTKILKAAGIDFMTLGSEEYCCGAILWQTGQKEMAEELIQHNVDVIRKTGAKTLLVSCAHCYGTFKREYPKIVGTLDFKVLHVSELMKNLIDEGKLKLTKKIGLRVTYHDPCWLGRLGETYIHWEGEIGLLGVTKPPKKWLFGSKGIYDPPREVLKAIPGVELVEMERNREISWCCGAGGGVKEAYPDFALWTAKERLEEAKDIAAEAIISCCPHCAINFEKAIAENKESIRYYDLTELAFKAL